MSLANRLAQLDAELDAFQKSPEALEDVRTRLLAARDSDLASVDRELDALAADSAGMEAVLAAARQQAAERSAQVASVAAETAERAKAARAEVDARLAAQRAEQDAARQERANKSAQEAAERDAAARERAARAASEQAERSAAAALRAEEEAKERAARAAAAEQDAAARAAAAREAAVSGAAVSGAAAVAQPVVREQSPASTLTQLFADELEEEAQAQAASRDTRGASEPLSDDTELFGTDLFGDLGTDAFDAPQDRLDDVVSSDARGSQASAFVDLASLLEQEEARPAASPQRPASESDDVMSALFDEPAAPVAEARPRTVPPPVPTPGSVRPPALPAATLGVARESFEDLSDEIDMMEVDDFDIVIDESGLDEDAGTGTELDGPGLSTEELAPDAMHTAPDGTEDPEKKGGFFKKLFR